MKNIKILDWVRRYGPAEILSTALAYAGARVAYDTTKDSTYAALAATWAGNLGYYGPVFVQDIYKRCKDVKEKGKKIGLKDIAQTVRNLALEFGPSGALDAFVTRPLLTKICMDKCGNDAGMFLGRYSADAIFYGLTIPTYETIKRMKLNR